MKRFLVYFFLFCVINFGYSTVEIVYQNKILKEIHAYIQEDNSYIGMGWSEVDTSTEKLYKENIQALEAKGYKWTKFPYKLELILFFVFVLLSGLSGSRYSKMQRYRRQHEEK